MGFNLNGRDGVYSSRENLEEILDSIPWSSVGYNNWQEAEDAGLLSIGEIEG